MLSNPCRFRVRIWWIWWPQVIDFVAADLVDFVAADMVDFVTAGFAGFAVAQNKVGGLLKEGGASLAGPSAVLPSNIGNPRVGSQGVLGSIGGGGTPADAEESRGLPWPPVISRGLP